MQLKPGTLLHDLWTLEQSTNEGLQNYFKVLIKLTNYHTFFLLVKCFLIALKTRFNLEFSDMEEKPWLMDRDPSSPPSLFLTPRVPLSPKGPCGFICEAPAIFPNSSSTSTHSSCFLDSSVIRSSLLTD